MATKNGKEFSQLSFRSRNIQTDDTTEYVGSVGADGTHGQILATKLPVTEAATAALALKANLLNPVFEGIVSVPTPTTDEAAANKGYVDSVLVGVLNDRGQWDASGNAFPTTGGSGTGGVIRKGDLWYVSVAGKLGGVDVNVGDSFRALTNNPAQVASNWGIFESNIGYVPENVVNKQNNLNTDATNSKYPTVTAVNSGLALKANIDSPTFTGVPLTTTPALGDNSKKIASTEFVASASVASATKLTTPRAINGVPFDGTANITVIDSTKVSKTGDTMTGELVLPSATISSVPATSSIDSYNFLTRNTTTGKVEKVLASSVPLDSNVLHKTGNETKTGTLTLANALVATAGNAYGTNISNILTAIADNDRLVGLRVNPTYNVGSFSGVRKTALLIGSGVLEVMTLGGSDDRGIVLSGSDQKIASIFRREATGGASVHFDVQNDLVFNTGVRDLTAESVKALTISALGISVFEKTPVLVETPVTSAAGYDVLTRNSTTGKVEKVSGSSIAPQLTMIDYPLLTADNSTFAIPAGRTAKIVSVNGATYYQLTENNTTLWNTFNQVGSNVILKTSAEVGNYVSIFYQ